MADRADGRTDAAVVQRPAERVVVGEHPHGRTATREPFIPRWRRRALGLDGDVSPMGKDLTGQVRGGDA